jgi:pimeloyl-ACP methyl ester carboxylesterase
MSARFFGHPESPLFGVCHAARGRKTRASLRSRETAVRAALICPPIGQEYIRTHWCLRLLAKQLARVGVDVLRMDYHGIGDSFGIPEQIHSLADWTRNIEQAIDHLKEASGAQTVMLIGQRLGGTLATRVASRRPDVNSLVLWEPIVDGQDYLNELRSMHAQMLDLWVCPMQTPNDERVEEILGTRYSRSLLDEIEQIRLDISQIMQPQLIVDIESRRPSYRHPEPSLLKVIFEPNEGRWDDLEVLETARLRPTSTRTIVKTVDEMFTRLHRFAALTVEGIESGWTSTPNPEGVR